MLESTGWHDLPAVRQFLKYGLVGASNTIVNFVVYGVLVTLGLHYLVALVLGYLAGALNSYILNRHWTFRAGHVAHSTAGQPLRAGDSVRDRRQRRTAVPARASPGHREDPGPGRPVVPILAVTFPIDRWWSFAHPGGPTDPPTAS